MMNTQQKLIILLITIIFSLYPLFSHDNINNFILHNDLIVDTDKIKDTNTNKIKNKDQKIKEVKIETAKVTSPKKIKEVTNEVKFETAKSDKKIKLNEYNNNTEFKSLEQEVYYLNKKCTDHSEKLEKKITLFANQIKKKNTDQSIISELQSTIQEVYSTHEKFLGIIDNEQKKSIKKQTHIMVEIEKKIKILIHTLEINIKENNNEKTSLCIQAINFEIDKLNRQLRAINWILFEQ